MLRAYCTKLLRRGWGIVKRPVGAGIALGGSLVSLLVVFNEPLMNRIVRAYQGIPWWWGLVLFGLLLLCVLFRAGYEEYREGERERQELNQSLKESESEIKQPTANLQAIKQERERLTTGLREVRKELEELEAKSQVQITAEIEPQSGSLPFPLPKQLPPNKVSQLSLSNESFQITDLVRGGGNTILNRTFEHCTIHGPAVILLQGSSALQESTFVGEDGEAMYWEINEARKRVVGVVAAANCVFRRCTFVGIGLAGQPELIQKFREGIC